MKYTLLLVLFAVAATAMQVDYSFIPRRGLPPPLPSTTKSLRTKWNVMVQKLDNFDPDNQQTWNMRYVENDQYFIPGGPIFILLGAEDKISEYMVSDSQMVDMGAQHGAYLINTEHRYYGESYPTSDLSSENLKYLTTPQALADYAHFIKTIKQDPKFQNSKVVVFGASYGANLATWMRQQYPDLVHAAVASSGPLLAHFDFKEYHGVVKKVLGAECASVLMNGSAEIRRLLNNGQKAKVEQDFNLCYPIESEIDAEALFSYISAKIGGEIQYAEPSTASTLCSKLQDASLSSDYKRLVSYSTDSAYCKTNYKGTIEAYKNISLNSGDFRQWIYQTCVAYGFFQSAWGDQSLYNYGVSAHFYSQQCTDIFGPSFTEEVVKSGIEDTNQRYGALNPDVTRVVTIHGTGDPWHAIGLSQDVNPSSPTYVVEGTSHCADIYRMSYYANEEMRVTKLNVAAWVDKWLKEP